MAKNGIYLDIDISDAKEKIDALRAVHTEKEMNALLRRAVTRTGNHVRTIVGKEASKHYVITQKKVKSYIGSPEISSGTGAIGVSCCIPIKGRRMSIGGTFKASGGAPGWSVRKGKRYKINAKIIKSQRSTMPEVMNHQGGNPPFINTSAPKLHGVAFTRTGKKTKNGKDAIARVVGIGVPQMPINRAEDDIQKDVMDMLMDRLEAEHKFIISRCR